MPLIIGLTGVKHSGKDTTADFISRWCEANDVLFVRESFAKPVIESGCGLLECPADRWSDLKHASVTVRMPTGEEFYTTGRHVVRDHGMVLTDIYPEYLINRIDQVIDETSDRLSQHAPAVILVTDVRRELEVNWLKQRYNAGYDVALVHILPRVSIASLVDGHETEQPLCVQDFSSVISNDSSIAQLETNTNNWCDRNIASYVEAKRTI